VIGGTLPFVAAWLTGIGGGSPWLVAVYCGLLCLLCAGGTALLPRVSPGATVTGRSAGQVAGLS